MFTLLVDRNLRLIVIVNNLVLLKTASLCAYFISFLDSDLSSVISM